MFAHKINQTTEQYEYSSNSWSFIVRKKNKLKYAAKK